MIPSGEAVRIHPSTLAIRWSPAARYVQPLGAHIPPPTHILFIASYLTQHISPPPSSGHPSPGRPQGLVDQCRKLLAPSLTAYVSESYDRAYYSVCLAHIFFSDLPE